MLTTEFPKLISGGHEVESGPAVLGQLRDSAPELHDVELLRQRMREEGYLFLRGLLRSHEVLAARAEILGRLQREGHLVSGSELMDGVLVPEHRNAFRQDLTRDNQALMTVLYDGPIMDFWRQFFGEPVRHFDFTWLRTVPPGPGTPSHCDVVYMGRGTPELYTAWTPLGSIDFTLGGLMILEGSNNHAKLRETYCKEDVDAYCVNKDGPAGQDAWQRGTGGWLGRNPNQIRRSLGGRWLTSTFEPGDVLVFSVFTVHASLDNSTADRIRLSSDSRYQRASEPADERWIGPNPPGHGPNAKRGLIC